MRSFKNGRFPPPRRKRKPADAPRFIRFSGAQMSDPDFWKERAEAEAAREVAFEAAASWPDASTPISWCRSQTNCM